MSSTLNINIIQISAALTGILQSENLHEIPAPSYYKEKTNSDFFKKADVFILAVEGSYKYLDNLNLEESKELLTDTKGVIDEFYQLEESLNEVGSIENEISKIKFKHIYKTLYKFENILHKNVFKNVEIIKTPSDVLDGISKTNRRTLSKLIK
ncbi:hypothetical protein ERX46_16370 [Brumimicrobium glaciale]|uniref:Uncharacterized protein n=1 Tax=Brumimicrobium glaciale TaxID=200475 RepID=A0A4Q4KEH4_9FLAO|nr:hypothetical protein [Brumimicrobium glaciale]RYM31481.1 hypothetical protein ERX46_16370 [Brumimicrobium glaciale]